MSCGGPGRRWFEGRADKTLEEGKDFDAGEDPKLGNVPFAGRI